MAREDSTPEGRRRLVELGIFLRLRREKLRPSDVGLPPLGRRHVRGLRREEVAGLAGIGSSWYASLEQGNVDRVGEKTLLAVAAALRLTPAEVAYVFALVDERAPRSSASDAIDEAEIHFVESLSAIAFATTARSDVLVYNAPADRVFAFSTYDRAERNVLALMVRERRLREVFADWRETLQRMIASARVGYARASEADIAFISSLREESAEFSELWDRYEIAAPTGHRCRIRLAPDDIAEYDFLAYAPQEHPAQTLVVLSRR